MVDKMVEVDVSTLKGRTRWAIDFIIKKDRLSNSKLGEMMELATGTINNYRRMLTIPNIEFVLKFCELFKFSILWFVQGTGYPFAGAKESHPESKGPFEHPRPPDMPGLFGPDADKPFVPLKRVEIITRGDADQQAGAPEFSIAEDLTLAAKVLESRTHYATALHLNIRSFAGAVKDATALNNVLARLEDLESKVDTLQAENKALRTEVNRLKATYEDPGDGSGHRTNTDNQAM